MIGNQPSPTSLMTKSILQDECLRLTRSCTRLNVIMEQPLATTCRWVRSSISGNNCERKRTQVDGDGDYLLVLKMSEVYFNAPNMKVFDVVLNGDLTVSSDLDIFEKVSCCCWSESMDKKLFLQVGRGVAHDEYIEFSIEGNTILYQVLQPPRKYFNTSMNSYIFCPSPYDDLLITPGWREWDQCWQDQGGIHQELQGQPKDQRHRPDQGEQEETVLTFQTVHHSGDIGRLPQAGSTPCRARGGWSCRWSQGLQTKNSSSTIV